VESVDTPEQAAKIAAATALEHGTVVAVSGPVDHITDGTRLVKIANGHVWLTQVTGVGCALGALVAGFAAAVDDPLVAASAATALLTVAADAAAVLAYGPGSFAVALLDQLAAVTAAELAARVRLV
jgi:hydroxyethylthiazole kinase